MTPTVPIGSVAVSTGVSGAGQATAGFSIAVPPGRLGMTPELAIKYTSGPSSGMLGVGFTLSGVPYIERCALDSVHPERSAEHMVDLCLGGDRLILVEGAHGAHGARYRLRGTPSTIVEAVPGHEGQELAYVVHYGDGRVGTFGIQPQHTHGGRWYLSHLEDVYHNRIAYHYLRLVDGNRSVALLPDQIVYTINANTNPDDPDIDQVDLGTRRVRFEYQTLGITEDYTAYTRQGEHLVDRRLQRIRSEVLEDGAWTTASSYELGYSNASTTGRSLLHTVTRCDRDAVCLPAVTFEWELGEYGYAPKGLEHDAVLEAPSRSDMIYTVAADYDRDGRDEIAYLQGAWSPDHPNYRWTIWDPEEGIISTQAEARAVIEAYDEELDARRTNPALAPRGADFNGDGYPDIISPYCDTDSGMGCIDDAVTDVDFPYANAFAFALGGGGSSILYDEIDPPIVDTYVPTIDVSLFRGDERVFAVEVAEIDGDGHPDLFVCAGDDGGDAYWNLAINRITDGAGDDFQIVPTWRRCYAWDFYQVFDSNGNGLDELHVTKAPDPINRINACKMKGECLDSGDFSRSSTMYTALELPRVAADGTMISVDDALEMVGPQDAMVANASLDHDAGWPDGYFWESLPLDVGSRVLSSCWNPEELEQLESMDNVPQTYDQGGGTYQIPPAAVFGLEELESVDDAPWLDEVDLQGIFGSGDQPSDEMRLLAPFVTTGPSRDIHVDINGDGLVDVMRLLAVENGGTVPDSAHGSVVYEVASIGGIGPAVCRADTEFDYVYGYYINHGGHLVLEGSSPFVLEDQVPYVAANVLSQTIIADINADDRPDLSVPDYDAYLNDSDVASWNTWVKRPSLGSHLLLNDVFEMPDDLGGGPIWFNEGLLVSNAARAIPPYLDDLGYTLDQVAELTSEQVISGGLHLNDKLLNDVVVFNPAGSEVNVAAFEKLGDEPDYLVRVVDGLGAVQGEFTYSASRVIPGVVDGPNDQPGPFAKAAPKRLVTRHRVDAGTADLTARRWTDFEYEDGRSDRKGGHLGFAAVTRRSYTASAVAPFLVERSEYRDYLEYDEAHAVYPFAGFATDTLSERRAILAAGQSVRLVDWTHSEPAMLATDHPGIVTTYVQSSDAARYEMPATQCDGDFCDVDELSTTYRLSLTETEVEDIDAFGNILESQAESLDGSSIFTARSFVNLTDPAALWRLGIADAETIEHSGPNGDVRVLRTDYEIDPDTAARTAETRNPLPFGDADTFLRTESKRDWRGNLVATVERDLANVGDVTAGATRLTTTEWDALGYFPTATRNADGWGTSTWFEPYFGMLVATQGPGTNAVSQTCVDGLGRATCSRTTWGMLGGSIGDDLTFTMEPEALYNGAYRRVTRRNGTEIDRVVLDRLGRETAHIYPVLNDTGVNDTPDWYKVLTVYNRRGLVESRSVPLALAVNPVPADLDQYIYDAAGRRTSTTLSGGRGSLRWSYTGLAAYVTDADDRTSMARVSPSGQTIYTQDGKGVGTCYHYGALGKLVQVSRDCPNEFGHNDGDLTAGELDTVFEYDAIGRRVTATSPETGTNTTAYNAFGGVRETKDSLGAITTFAYDHLGRLETRTGADHEASWDYDVGFNSLGKLSATHISYDDGTTVDKTYWYDVWGRPLATMQDVLGQNMFQSVQYGGQNQIAQSVYNTVYENAAGVPAHEVSFAYTSHGFLRTVGDTGDADRFYRERRADGWGHPIDGRFGDDTLRTAKYTARTGRIESVRTTNAALAPAVPMGWSYTWTNDGDLAYRYDEVTKAGQCFTYDAAHQLTRISSLKAGTDCKSGILTTRLDLAYDDLGHITRKSDVPGGGLFSYDTDGMLMSAGNYGLSHDDKGQLTVRWNTGGVNTAADWFSFSQVQRLDGAGDTVLFYYDADGAQAAKLETTSGRTSIYLGSHTRVVTPATTEERISIASTTGTIAELAITAPVVINAPGVQKVSFLHADAHGSPTAVVRAGVVSQRRYDPYGRRQDLPNVPDTGVRSDSLMTGFTGHESESVYDLINMRARYFDSLLASFVQADSIVPSPDLGIDWNRYAYVRNNPLRFADPSGHGSSNQSGGDDDDGGGDGGGGGGGSLDQDSGNEESHTDGSCETLSRAMGMSGVCGDWSFDDGVGISVYRAPVGNGKLGNSGDAANTADNQTSSPEAAPAEAASSGTSSGGGFGFVMLPGGARVPVLFLALAPPPMDELDGVQADLEAEKAANEALEAENAALKEQRDEALKDTDTTLGEIKAPDASVKVDAPGLALFAITLLALKDPKLAATVAGGEMGVPKVVSRPKQDGEGNLVEGEVEFGFEWGPFTVYADAGTPRTTLEEVVAIPFPPGPMRTVAVANTKVVEGYVGMLYDNIKLNGVEFALPGVGAYSLMTGKAANVTENVGDAIEAVSDWWND